MSDRVEVNPDEMFLVADRVILVEEYESVLGAMSKIGVTKNPEPGYLFTFKGRLNRTEEYGEVTVAMPLAEAYELACSIVKWTEEFAVTNGLVPPRG